MPDKSSSEIERIIKEFAEKGKYKRLFVEIFKGGEDNGEIFLEGECLFSKLFEDPDLLVSFLKNVKIISKYFGKKTIFLLSKDGKVYVIHGLILQNFL